MGSIRYDNKGKGLHWSDVWQKFAAEKIRKLRQRKSFSGQLLLFGDERKPEKTEERVDT